MVASSSAVSDGDVGVLSGADLIESVLDLVEQLPAGQVSSYGAIAARAGIGPRQVARIMSTHGSAVPWWRVLRADGSIPQQLLAQARPLLEAEGIAVADGRVDRSTARATLDM